MGPKGLIRYAKEEITSLYSNTFFPLFFVITKMSCYDYYVEENFLSTEKVSGKCHTWL